MNVKMTLNFQVIIILCCHFTSAEAQAISISVPKQKQNTSSKILLNGTEIHGEPNYFKIVGGYEADDSFEYLVSVQASGKHTCGGTLLSQYWVLTAAHCVTKVINGKLIKYAAQIYRIKVGNKHLHAINSRFCLCEKIYLQDEYAPPSLNYDIALIKLKNSCAQKNYMTLANRKEIQELPRSKLCKTVGWGSTGLNEKHSLVLLESPASLIGDECGDYFEINIALNLERHLCTFDKGVTLCVRDSGGPLICDDKQVGIAVFTGECSNVTVIPVVYIKIDEYLHWIHYMMNYSNSLTKISYSVLCFSIILNVLLR